MTQHIIHPPASVALLGGTGFVGRALALALEAAGYRVRIVTRREQTVPGLAVLPSVETRVLGAPGGEAALADALQGCEVVVNLIGILHESPRASFADVHVGLTERALAAAQAAGVTRFIQVSALGAAVDAPSRYLRSKAEAEARVRAAPIAWTILRPSVIFGREDAFLNLFAGLARLLPVLVIPCPDARFQPIHVDDVAHAVVSCLTVPDTISQSLELGGPEVFTMRELMVRVGIWTGTRRPVLGLPVPLSMLQAAVFERLPGQLMSRDNVRSMQVPNVCAGGFPELLGFSPAAMDRVVPEYLVPDDGRARYSRLRGLAGR